MSILCIYIIQKSNIFVKLFRLIVIPIFCTLSYIVLQKGNIEIFDIVKNRLISGIDNVLSWGQTGYNPRFSGFVDVLSHLKNNDLLWTGYGLNSASIYFSYYGDLVRDYSLFLTLLFSYGIIGVLIFYTFCIYALKRMVNLNSKFIYIFIPFLIVSLINSAQGFVTYKFVIIGVIYYGIFNRKEVENILSVRRVCHPYGSLDKRNG
jgi:hypothetical protein